MAATRPEPSAYDVYVESIIAKAQPLTQEQFDALRRLLRNDLGRTTDAAS